MLVSSQLNELILRAVCFRPKEPGIENRRKENKYFPADLFVESRRAVVRFDVAIDNVNVCTDGVTANGV